MRHLKNAFAGSLFNSVFHFSRRSRAFVNTESLCFSELEGRWQMHASIQPGEDLRRRPGRGSLLGDVASSRRLALTAFAYSQDVSQDGQHVGIRTREGRAR